MTEKKHHKHEDNHVNAQMTSLPQEGLPESHDLTEGEAQAAMELDEAQINELRKKLAEAEFKAAENLDGWQRAVAEFQNYKKRIERDREADKASMKADLIKRVLPVLDDLERALKNKPIDSSAGEAWSGIELIVRKLQGIFESEGLNRIEADGAVFDPNFHEAISYEPMDGFESGRVIAIVQNGYMLGDRVVRPATVRVAK